MATVDDAATRHQLRSLAERYAQGVDRRDVDTFVALFHDESYWRDLVAFTWNIKTLEGPAKGEELNRDYMLGSVLAMWLNQPDVGYSPKRSAVGCSAESSSPRRSLRMPPCPR